jgi:hypothetical protein
MNKIHEFAPIPSETQKTRLAWRLEQIATETGLSVQFLRKEIRNGRLQTRKIGRCVVVLNQDLMNFLQID